MHTLPGIIQPNKSRRILLYQAGAFLLIITLSWVDELINLPTRLFGSHGWRESAMETAVVLAVWVPSFVVTRRLLARLHHLEGFLKVCAWCRKIGHGDTWIPLEEYFARGFKIQTSHGICPQCANSQLAQHAEGAANE
jgi:hypothetical protein